MGGRAARHRILVVDDEKKLVEAVVAYLEAAGYDVTAASSGREALAALERESHSLVILDLMLPGIPGERVCAAVRAHSRVPVLILTAKVEELSVLEGFRVGADDYVTKPFTSPSCSRSSSGAAPDEPPRRAALSSGMSHAALQQPLDAPLFGPAGS